MIVVNQTKQKINGKARPRFEQHDRDRNNADGNLLYFFSHIHVMLLATAAYIVCIVGIIMMYVWYAPEPSCLLNIFFITWTLVLIQLMTSVSLHPKVRTQTSPDCIIP